jgi:hypothetical protein
LKIIVNNNKSNIDNRIAHNIVDNMRFILLKHCNIVSIV